MAIILKCVGWLFVVLSAFALAGAMLGFEWLVAGSERPMLLAVCAFGFCIIGIMLAAFGEVVGHLAAIDRATAAQFALLHGGRRPPIDTEEEASRLALRRWVDRFA